MTDHPDIEPAHSVHPLGSPPDRLALAELDAGLPDEAAAVLAAQHVTGCAECQAVLSGLRATRAALGALGGTPMPAAVADRIAAALEAERAGVEETQPDAGDLTGADSARRGEAEVIELRSARRQRRLRLASGLAAGIVLLGGGGYLIGNFQVGGEDSATVADGGEAAVPEFGEDSGAGGEELPSYDRQSLEAAVGDLLEGSPRSTPGGAGEPETAGGEGGAPSDVDADCLASIPVATAQALSITRVSYEGRPAIVVLFTAEPGRVQVTVLSDCLDGSSPAVIDEFEAAR